MLQVWGRRSAFNVQKVMWLIGELGLPHEHIPAGGEFGIKNDPAFLAMNPHGRVPVIKDGETVVWESHSILRYLAASYGDAALWPERPAARSEVDRWMDWAQCSLQTAFINGVFWGAFRTPDAQQNKPAIEESLQRCAGYFQLLDRVLSERPFLAGDNFSLADIAAGTNLYRYFELEITRPDIPHVEAWYARLQERPAYREHVMIPFGEMRGKLDF